MTDSRARLRAVLEQMASAPTDEDWGSPQNAVQWFVDGAKEALGLLAAADAVEDRLDPRVGRFRERLMMFGGFDRRHVVGDHEEGSFWVNRDDVLRLLDEEFGTADAVEGDRSDVEFRNENTSTSSSRFTPGKSSRLEERALYGAGPITGIPEPGATLVGLLWTRPERCPTCPPPEHRVETWAEYQERHGNP